MINLSRISGLNRFELSSTLYLDKLQLQSCQMYVLCPRHYRISGTVGQAVWDGVGEAGCACDCSLLHRLRFGAAGHESKDRKDSVCWWGTSLNKYTKIKQKAS